MERQSPNSEMQQEALLKFSINNILRPDFGSSGPPSTDLTSPVSNFLSPTMMYVQAAQQLNALTAASNLIKSFSTNDFLTSARALQVLTTTSESIQQKSEQASPSPILASPSIQKTKLSPSSPEPTTDKAPSNSKDAAAKNGVLWPAWVYCTRYSDRPSSGPRCRKIKRRANADEKRPRTAFTSDQLSRLKDEFQQNRYLTEKRRQDLANELGLKESQIKIWFQNKRAKIKKQVGVRNPLAMQLMSQGLYNHATIPVSGSEEEGSEMIKDME